MNNTNGKFVSSSIRRLSSGKPGSLIEVAQTPQFQELKNRIQSGKIKVLGLPDGFFGDQGKGMAGMLLAMLFDWTFRSTGGNNAGHTQYPWSGLKMITHHLPPGLFLGKPSVCGNGMVIDPKVILEEILNLRQNGFPVHQGIFFISDRAHVTCPWHIEIDVSRDASGRGIGSTGRGIGPAYFFKMARMGVQFYHLIDPDRLWERMNEIRPFVEQQRSFVHPKTNGRYTDAEWGRLFRTLRKYGSEKYLGRFVTNTSYLINQVIDSGKRVLFEGAQGAGLDIDHGTYPYVTSSCPTVGGFSTGSGVAGSRFDEMWMIAKAYATRVGAGGYPSLDEGPLGKKLRDRGAEFGSTTGRPRDCGWFDTVYNRYAWMLNQPTGLIITKIDVLSGFQKIYFCEGYRINGKVYKQVPSNVKDFQRAEPVYTSLPGWRRDIRGTTSKDQLPANAVDVIDYYNDNVGPVVMVSTGPEAHEFMMW